MAIEIIRTKTTIEHLGEVAAQTYGDFVKVVVDVARRVMAIGGELHSDEEAALLDDGSDQENLWGANVYPGRPPGQRIEYTSLINIRPSQGNRTQGIASATVRSKVSEAVGSLVEGV